MKEHSSYNRHLVNPDEQPSEDLRRLLALKEHILHSLIEQQQAISAESARD
jgi:hypothetical protein